MTVYDISNPHDLRVVLGKPSITTDEVDSFIEVVRVLVEV